MQIFRPWSDQRVTAMATHAFKYSRPVDSKPFTQDIALSDWRARFSTSPSTSFGVWTPSTYTTADLMSLAQTIFAARNGLSLSEAQQVLSAQILFESQTPLTAYFTFLESLWRTLDSHPNHENDSSIVQWMRSHQFSGFSCEELLERTRSRLRENSSEEFEALDQLTLKIVETDWGRGLLECQGLSGCMTDALFDSDALAALKAKGDKAPWADRFFFLEAPTVRATQERFKIFQKLTKDLLKDYIKSKDIVTLASLPCGRLRDC
ncbi:MAG: hypothetical protein IPJ69_14900 [Deltaproteobacteria bacterium]|nr:MAG: hypothetical protein IPJ69_14900 [Deltaproteobacteria bacterium]